MSGFFENLAGLFPKVTREDWRAAVDKALVGEAFEKKLVTTTAEGFHTLPLYSAQEDSDERNRFPPGRFPFVRGLSVSSEEGGSRLRWTHASQIGHPCIKESQKLVMEELMGGVESLELHVVAAASGLLAAQTPAWVPKGGIWIDEANDLKKVIEGVDCRLAPVSFRFADPNSVSFASFFAAFGKGNPGVSLQIDFWNDILLRCSATDACPNLPTEMLEAFDDAFAKEKTTFSHGRFVLLSSESVHLSGGHHVLELASLLGQFATLLRCAQRHNWPLVDLVRAVEIRVSVGSDFFQEIAKIRALRKLLGFFLASMEFLPLAQHLFISAKTSEQTLSKLDVWNNLLRSTSQAFAASAAGVDKLLVTPFDLRSQGHTVQGHRLARNLQTVLEEECHLAAVRDPAGGSWFLEKRTDQLAEESWKLFHQWEGQGGLWHVVNSGVLSSLADAAWEIRKKNIHRRKESILGVNEYALSREPQWEKDKTFDSNAFLEQWKSKLAEKKEKIQEKRESNGSEIPAKTRFPKRFLSESFEQLRAAANQWQERKGKAPAVFLCYYSLAPHSARAVWVKNFMGLGGLNTFSSDARKTLTENLELYRKSESPVVVLISTDDKYESFVEEYASAFRANGAAEVWIAGNLKEKESLLRAWGVSEFVFAGCDAYLLLRSLLVAQGVAL
jgi:methylmalonyl-CoA mutase